MLWLEFQPGAYVTDGTRLLEVVHRNRATVDLVDCQTDELVILGDTQAMRSLTLVRAKEVVPHVA